MKKVFCALTLCFVSLFALEENELTWDDGPSAQEYNSALQKAIQRGDWWAVVDYADLISYNFPTSPYASEASFIMGEAYYKLDQLDYANDCFSAYLQQSISPKNFERAIEYKFNIAERFAEGEKKHLFGSIKMPSWVPAEEDSLEIFDEVIAALPHSEFATRSLLSKARVQAYMEDFKLGVETLDLLIRRFPRHELAAEAYLEKGRIFLKQCETQSPDPDILDLAEMNLHKFRLAFPRESRVKEAEEVFAQIQEIFAQNLYQTGCFFEKTKKTKACCIYFHKVINKYPDSEAASSSRKKLEILEPLGRA